MGRRSKLTPEERVEVVLALLRTEEPIAALSRRYSVSEQTLYRWRDELVEAGRAGLARVETEASESARRIADWRRSWTGERRRSAS